MVQTQSRSLGSLGACRARTSKHALVVTTVADTVRAFLRPHVAQLQRRGWDVSIATGGGLRDLGDIDADVIELPFSRHPMQVFSHAKSYRRLRQYVRGHKPDLIYVHTAVASAIVRMVVASLRPRERPRVVYFAHGFHFLGESERGVVGWLWYAVERALSRWTDTIIVINRDDHGSISEWPIAKRGDVHLIPGVGFDATHYSRRGLKRPGPTGASRRLPRVLCISETTRNKRHRLLLAAVARIEVHLVLVGPGTDSPRLRSLIASFGLSHRVDCIGYVHDVRPFIEDADVTVLVSRREGLPRSLIESLAIGTPIVVTRTRGSRDLAHAVDCPIADEATPAAVAEAICAGLRDSRDPSEIREQFLEAWSTGTTECIVERVSEVLESTLRQPLRR